MAYAVSDQNVSQSAQFRGNYGCLGNPQDTQPACPSERLAMLALRCHPLCLHCLLYWPLLQSSGILSAGKFVPAFRLPNPFASIQGLSPRPL